MQAVIDTFFAVKHIPLLVVYSVIFSCKQPIRKKGFLFGILLFLASTVGLYFLWEWMKMQYENPLFWLMSFGYALLSFLAVLSVNKLCFYCTFSEATLYAVGGYTATHLGETLSILSGTVLKVEGMVYRPYSLAYFLLFVGINLALYALLFFFFYYSVKDRTLNIDRKNLFPPIVLAFAVFNILTHFTNNFGFEAEQKIIVRLYDVAVCVVLFLLLFSIFQSSKNRTELEVVKELNKKSEEQYNLFYSTASALDVKYHDLKKMLTPVLSGERLLEKEDIDPILEKISIYDSMMDTGDKTIDLALTEKMLFCEKNRIMLMPTAHVEHKTSLTKAELYSLVGNILDNAIEAVLKLPEKERIISFSMKEVGNMLLIHEDNPFDGQLSYKNGKIVTRKKQKELHGYGLISIQNTVEKNGGTVKISIDEALNVFEMDVLLLLSKDDSSNKNDNSSGNIERKIIL